jgi:hypothetical protein
VGGRGHGVSGPQAPGWVASVTQPHGAPRPCATCEAQVIDALHWRTLKPSVVDAEPSPEGTINLIVQSERPPIYTILKEEQRFGRRDLRVSHFATCRDAASWRKGASP